MGYPRLDSFPLASSGMKTATGAVVRLDDECATLIDLRDNWEMRSERKLRPKQVAHFTGWTGLRRGNYHRRHEYFIEPENVSAEWGACG